MSTNWNSYLIEALRGDICSREAELESIRNSLRYRLGGWVIEALPLGKKTFLLFFKLIAFYFKRRYRVISKTVVPSKEPLNIINSNAFTVVYGQEIPEYLQNSEILITDIASVLSGLLDAMKPQGVLVVRQLDQDVLRRIVRIRNNGWRVVWHPDDFIEYDPAFMAYIIAHADECIESSSI